MLTPAPVQALALRRSVPYNVRSLPLSEGPVAPGHQSSCFGRGALLVGPHTTTLVP
jgi:hypothetical protein